MTQESMGGSPPGFVKCPHCSAWVDKKEASCTACGNEVIATTTKKCPHCYSDIDARASVCPHCSKNVRVKTAGYQIGSLIGALGLLMALGGLAVGSGFIIGLGLLLLLIGLVVRRNA